MKADNLMTLLKCPKKYELEQTVFHYETQKEASFRKALDIAAIQLAGKAGWEDAAGKIESVLREEYAEQWFELSWQKKQAVRDDLFRIRRLYCWLSGRTAGKAQALKPLEVNFEASYAGHEIHNLQIQADLVIEKPDGKIQGIILYRRFSRPYSYYAKKADNHVFFSAELLCLMGGIKICYPEKQVEVMMVRAESASDRAGYFSMFEEKRGDNILRFTEEELWKSGVESVEERLGEIMSHVHTESCRNCIFTEICRPPVQIPFKREATDKMKVREPLSYTEKQERAVRHRDGALRVCAGPGAGKTEVLTGRICRLMKNGVSPKRILAVTYTKRAGREIMERIESKEKPDVMTLHALGYRIARQHEHLIGKKKLVNKVDCMQMLLYILNRMPVIQGASYERICTAGGLLECLLKDFSFINKYGAEKLQKQYPQKDVAGILQIKEQYEQKFRAMGYILYEDQVRLAVEILEAYPGVQKKMQKAYDYIMVDEAQDLDEMQARLIRLVTDPLCNNIALYGDADQSIYGFRGGSNQFMLRFSEIYPDAADIRLNDNFRSAKGIMTAANTLISHNIERVAFQMNAHVKTEFLPVLIHNFRANRIGAFIQDVLHMGYRQEDIAVIARTNKELECMCSMLGQYNEAHPDETMLGFNKPKYYLCNDSTFQAILDLLTIYLGDFSDDMVWFRLLNMLGEIPEKGEPKRTLYEDYLARGMIYPLAGEEETRYLSVTASDSRILQAFSKIYRAAKCFVLPARQAILRAMELFCDEKIDYKEVLEILDEKFRERNIRNAGQMWTYLSSVKRFRDDTRLFYETGQEGRIQLLTAHDSKGKEFPVVLVYGVDDFEKNEPQEERRLLYVAMTRAKERLYLTEICKGKSMFIKEFEEKLKIMGGTQYA